MQSNAITQLSGENKSLKKSLEELRAEIRFLMSGKKREKFIGADQMLIKFEDDKELQAALEAAKKEAEQELEKIAYTRSKQPKERKPAADKFPAHFPREEVAVTIPPAFQARIDSGELFIIPRQQPTSSMANLDCICLCIASKMCMRRVA